MSSTSDEAKPRFAADEDSSSDETIGAEAEKEFEEAVVEEPVIEEKTKPKRVKLTNGQRLKLIDAYRQGKTDKFYNVIPDKKKPGDYRIVKRRKPLDIPVVDTCPNPDEIVMESPLSETNIPKQTIQVDRSEKNNKIKQEFFTMQNTINNSLSKEIAAVMEKCNKIEAKMKKQKAKMKEMRRVQPEPIEEYEYDEEDEQNEQYQEEYYNEPSYYSRFNARRRIDLRNFS
jgi:hypothetical protein